MKLFEFEFPEDRSYDKEHVWFKEEEGRQRIGITDFFQKMANEIVFVELPAAGRNLETGKPFASIESGKWVGRVKATVGGTVAKTNGELADFPYLLNDSPYDEGWLIEITPAQEGFANVLYDLKDPRQLKEYESFLEEEKQRIASMSK